MSWRLGGGEIVSAFEGIDDCDWQGEELVHDLCLQAEAGNHQWRPLEIPQKTHEAMYVCRAMIQRCREDREARADAIRRASRLKR